MARRKPWRDWRIEAEAFGLLWCAGACDRSPTYHRRGEVDNYGTLHWVGFSDRRSSARGLRTFLFLVGRALNRKWRYEPYWKQLYLLQRWAEKESFHRWHRRMPNYGLEADMAKAQRQMRREKITRSKMGDGCYLWYWRHGYAPVVRRANKRPFLTWMGSRSQYRRDMMSTSTDRTG